MTVSVANVRAHSEYERTIADARKDGAGAIIAPMDGEAFRFRAELARLALGHRLPGVYGDAGYAQAGGLMFYSSSFAHRLQRAASYVDRILKGANPGELPVEQPSKFELVVNLKTAKALGVRIPQQILLRADTVIE